MNALWRANCNLWLAIAMVASACNRSQPFGNSSLAPLVSASTAVPRLSVPASPMADRPERVAGKQRMGLNLLGIVPAKIAVSSAVRNPRDFPEHLVDGDPYTAWNSQTADLEGAWIAFRVPADAQVDAIELTAGYVRMKGTEDLFTMNHRIRRVEVLHNGKLLKIAELDVQSRALQRVPVNADGGDFKVVVRETLPGSEARWREVVVSEFRVLGQPGAERRAATDRLRVSVGSLDATSPAPMGSEIDLESDAIAPELRHEYRSIEEFCKEFLVWAKSHAAAEIAEFQQWSDASPVHEPLCQEVPVSELKNAAPPWMGAKGVRLAWAFHDATRLLAVTLKGLRPTPIYFDDHYGNPMGCPPVWSRERLDRLRVESGWLIATIDGTGPSTYDKEGLLVSRAYQRGVAMCHLAGSGLRCLELNPQYERSLATKTLRSAGNRDPSPDAVPWERVEEFHVDESGKISRLRVR